MAEGRPLHPASLGWPTARALDKALQPARHAGEVHPGALRHPRSLKQFSTSQTTAPRPGLGGKKDGVELRDEPALVFDEFVNGRSKPCVSLNQAIVIRGIRALLPERGFDGRPYSDGSSAVHVANYRRG